MTVLEILGIILALVLVTALVFFLGWRWASRVWSLPCPTSLAWLLENPLFECWNGTHVTLERMDLRPGQRLLEIGPGPGRLLLPAAQRILPGGTAVGIDIQRGMIERLQAQAQRASLSNLTAILGDATKPLVAEATFDLVVLATTLGEIPDRAAVLAQCYRALRPGGVLSITELFGDPHYQSRATVKKLAAAAGFEPQSIQGNWRLFTANFVKPGAETA